MDVALPRGRAVGGLLTVPEGLTVRSARPTDAASWERMREALWPSESGEHGVEIAEYFRGDRRRVAEVLLAVDADDRPIGLAEVSIRSVAEGCATGQVAYLEGWYVDEEVRRTGVGAALMRAVEGWARAEGCRELASDTGIDNLESVAAHRALGFEETERIVCFRKDL